MRNPNRGPALTGGPSSPPSTVVDESELNPGSRVTPIVSPPEWLDDAIAEELPKDPAAEVSEDPFWSQAPRYSIANPISLPPPLRAAASPRRRSGARWLLAVAIGLVIIVAGVELGCAARSPGSPRPLLIAFK